MGLRSSVDSGSHQNCGAVLIGFWLPFCTCWDVAGACMCTCVYVYMCALACATSSAHCICLLCNLYQALLQLCTVMEHRNVEVAINHGVCDLAVPVGSLHYSLYMSRNVR